MKVAIRQYHFFWHTPRKINMEPKNGVWKMMFLFNQVISRFHINFPGCITKNHAMEPNQKHTSISAPMGGLIPKSRAGPRADLISNSSQLFSRSLCKGKFTPSTHLHQYKCTVIVLVRNPQLILMKIVLWYTLCGQQNIFTKNRLSGQMEWYFTNHTISPKKSPGCHFPKTITTIWGVPSVVFSVASRLSEAL